MGRIKLSGGASNGQNVFLKQPTSSQVTLKNIKNQEVKVKQGEFVYLNHPSELSLTIPQVIDRTTPVIVSNSTLVNMSPANMTNSRMMAINSKGHIFVAIIDRTTPSYKTVVYKSIDNGLTWNEKILHNTNGQFNPNICIDGNDRIMIVSSNQYSAQQGIRYYLSTNDGETYTAGDAYIVGNSSNYDNGGRLALCVDLVTNTFHVVFSQYFFEDPSYRNYSYHIKFLSSWSTPVRLIQLAKNESLFILANNGVIVAGSTETTTTNRSTDNGVTWSGVTFTTFTHYQYECSYIYIPASVSTKLNASYTSGIMMVAMVGADPLNSAVSSVKVTYSTDLGLTWSALKTITPLPIGCETPSITFDANCNVYVTYNTTSANAIYKIKMTNLTTWAEPELVLTSAGYSSTAIMLNGIIIENPLFVYKSTSVASARFYGKWSKATQFIDSQQNLTDFRTIVTTPNTLYTEQPGGRLVTVLSNGHIVASIFDVSNNILYFYKSTDNGQTWSQLTFFQANTLSGISIASYGTNVYAFVIDSNNTDGMWFFKFDETTVTNTNRYGTHIVVSTGTNKIASGTGFSSIAIGPTGNIHLAYSIKDVTYTTCYNIRYAKSINGGTSFTTSQVTKLNDSYNNYQNPVMLVTSADVPLIIVNQYNTNNAYSFYLLKETGLTSGGSFFNWTYSIIYNTTVVQSGVSAMLGTDDIVHLAWRGADLVEASSHIRYCKSTSTTYSAWTTHEKLTSGPTYSDGNPSIVVDASNNIHIMAFIRPTVSDYYIGYLKKTGSVWSGIEKFDKSPGAADVTCAIYKNITRPIAMYKDTSSYSAKFSGHWDLGSTMNNDKAKLQASGEGTLKSYGITPKHYIGNVMKEEVTF